MSHFKVSLIVWAKSRDSVLKPQFLKRKESQSGSNRGPSAYQPSTLPLGHTGAPLLSQTVSFISVRVSCLTEVLIVMRDVLTTALVSGLDPKSADINA